MTTARICLFAVGFGLLSATWAGCGNAEVAPVEGTITLGGKPIGPGVITFVPDKSKGNSGKGAVGYFEADGRYTLSTYEPGDGARRGNHHVFITPRAVGSSPNADPLPGQQKLPPIPKKYSNRNQSLLSAEVNAGSNTIDFDLQP